MGHNSWVRQKSSCELLWGVGIRFSPKLKSWSKLTYQDKKRVQNKFEFFPSYFNVQPIQLHFFGQFLFPKAHIYHSFFLTIYHFPNFALFFESLFYFINAMSLILSSVIINKWRSSIEGNFLRIYNHILYLRLTNIFLFLLTIRESGSNSP